MRMSDWSSDVCSSDLNLLVVLDNGARLAAGRGTRFDNGNIELENAAYTPFPAEDDEGCPKNPSWQIRAVKVMYDRVANKVRYKGARVEIFGLPLIPLPGLRSEEHTSEFQSLMRISSAVFCLKQKIHTTCDHNKGKTP